MVLAARKLPFWGWEWERERGERKMMHGVGVGMCVREKKLPSLHNNAMYVHPRLVSVCVRAHGPKLQRTMAKERGERKKRDRERKERSVGVARKGPRRGHGITVYFQVSISWCSLARRSTC
jgi:hypothetical protein